MKPGRSVRRRGVETRVPVHPEWGAEAFPHPVRAGAMGVISAAEVPGFSEGQTGQRPCRRALLTELAGLVRNLKLPESCTRPEINFSTEYRHP